jgi:hypothetical protein
VWSSIYYGVGECKILDSSSNVRRDYMVIYFEMGHFGGHILGLLDWVMHIKHWNGNSILGENGIFLSVSVKEILFPLRQIPFMFPYLCENVRDFPLYFFIHVILCTWVFGRCHGRGDINYLLFCSIKQYFTTRMYKINVEMMMTVVKGALWNVESSTVSTSDL